MNYEKGLVTRFFFQNWQRKLIALLSAIVIWIFVNSSITETKTIPNIPVRIVNLPSDKTIIGLLPNRLLSKRVTLTLSGTKGVIQELEPGDLEVLLDVSAATNEDWTVHIGKKNLISLNPAIDLLHHITHVDHTELTLKLSRLVTAKIPINVLPPIGEAAPGYEYLDIWPETLMQTIVGPEEEMQLLKSKGLDFQISLNNISKAELDAIKPVDSSSRDDEVSFPIPNPWKTVVAPFRNGVPEEINDPEAEFLRIDFLRKQYLPIGKELPITVFYPPQHSETLNSETAPLALGHLVQKKSGITFLNMPLYVRNVSYQFLETVRDNLEIVIVAAPQQEEGALEWSLNVIDPHHLENLYVTSLFNKAPGGTILSSQREQLLRKRFREYVQRLQLYATPGQELRLESRVNSKGIEVLSAK